MNCPVTSLEPHYHASNSIYHENLYSDHYPDFVQLLKPTHRALPKYQKSDSHKARPRALRQAGLNDWTTPPASFLHASNLHKELKEASVWFKGPPLNYIPLKLL